MTKKHKPPSRVRYEGAHPTVSFRVTQGELKQLEDIRKKTGLSLSEVMRRTLDLHSKDIKEAYARGYKKGLQAGSARFSVPCSVCGEPMEYDLKREVDAKQLLEAFSEWAHTNCQERDK